MPYFYDNQRSLCNLNFEFNQTFAIETDKFFYLLLLIFLFLNVDKVNIVFITIYNI
jgi:hypothetical protein